MPNYRITLPHGISTNIETTPDGTITHAEPLLKNSVGLRFGRFRNWVIRRGGEIQLLDERPAKQREKPQPSPYISDREVARRQRMVAFLNGDREPSILAGLEKAEYED